MKRAADQGRQKTVRNNPETVIPISSQLQYRPSRPSIKSTKVLYRPKLYKVIKKCLLISMIASTLVINAILLFNVMDYLNHLLSFVNLESMESGIVVALCFISIIFEVIGMFSVIKEEISFVIIYLILLGTGTFLSTLIYWLILGYKFHGLFAVNILIHTSVLILGSIFCVTITIDRKGNDETSPEASNTRQSVRRRRSSGRSGSRNRSQSGNY